MNLFSPYDILLRPQNPVLGQWQTTVAHESSVDEQSFQAEDPNGIVGNEFSIPVRTLQLFQDEQNALAAFKGAQPNTNVSEFAQRFNLHDDTAEHARFDVRADLDVHNTMISTYYHFYNGVSLSAHLPVIEMELSRLRFQENNANQTFEDRISPDIIDSIERMSGLDLHDWQRTGVGDLATIVSWQRYFPQPKPLLRNVAIGLRSGLTFPTGEDRDEDKILGLPFGYDAGVGALVGGTLELWLGPYVRYGFDSERLHHLGETQFRRVQTDPAQTDLLLANKDYVFKEAGFVQHFTIFGKVQDVVPGLAGRIAYQYTRQQEDKLFLSNPRFDPVVANQAESLQEWSTHSLVFDVTYIFRSGEQERFKPYMSLFAKHGFNGERAILLDSVGGQVGFDF